MGNTPLPNLKLNFKSNCCNGKKDEKDVKVVREDILRPYSPGWFRRSFKTKKFKSKFDEKDAEISKQTTSVHFAPPDEEKVPYETIQDVGD